MGSNRMEGEMMILDMVDFGRGENGVVPQQQIHRKHRRKKGDLLNGDTTGEFNGDADIVTPYQNGHYVPNGYQNGYNNRRSRLPQRYSSLDDSLDDDDDLQLKTGYGDYLSPAPPGNHSSLHNLLLDENQQQASVNNAITVAPSRTNLNDSNVFAGGRPSNNPQKRPNLRNNNRHNRHKTRSRTPDFTSSNHRLRLLNDEPQDSQSILNRIDLSIRKNFGDWDNDDGDLSKKLINGTNNGCAKPHRVPFFIPKSVASDSDVVGLNRDDLNLPRLFKPYESEVAVSRKVLNDKTFKVALSRDNDDPNSILSQAKKTLNYVSGQS